MGNWKEMLNEIQELGSTHDILRRKYLMELGKKTERNVIAYYSGWLQKHELSPAFVAINDNDKNGFMSVIKDLDKTKGLDLILHTPGGDVAATESLVDYLRSYFGTNIRAIIPQMAMSAGTMIACACKEILMGIHSSLGPIDPQLNGIPAHGVIEEFETACAAVKNDPSRIPIWQPIIAKYPPTFIGECAKAITWSESLVKEWLATGMFADLSDSERSKAAEKVFSQIGSHNTTLSHARHLTPEHCRDFGLKITMMETDPGLQDAILTVHHAFIHTLSSTHAVKIIENNMESAFIQSVGMKG